MPKEPPMSPSVEYLITRKLNFFRSSADTAINSLVQVLDKKNNHDLNYRIKCVEEVAELLLVYKTYIDCLITLKQEINNE